MGTQTIDRQQGQSLVLFLAFLAVCTLLLLGLFTLSLAVGEKIRLQMGADLAILSALNVQAETLNTLALGNRTILAHDALCAQLNAAVSEATFYRKLLDGFSNIVRFVPYGGPFLSNALRQGGHVVENLSRKSASVLVPISGRSNTLLEREQDLLMLSLPFRALRAAEDTVRLNTQRAKIPAIAGAALLGQTARRVKSIMSLSTEKTMPLVKNTLDRHTRRRDWSARIAGFNFPIRKQGSTKTSESDYQAFDRLKVKVLRGLRWRFRTLVSATSRASDFGYRGHGRILDLGDREQPWSLTLVLGSDLPPSPFIPPEKAPRFTAISSGALFYHRESKPEEKPNLLNPFWGSSLIPVEGEQLAKKLVPEVLLREVRH